MSTIDTDIFDEEGEVRYNIGDTAVPYLLDSTAIALVLDRYTDKTRAIRIYLASLDALRFLMAKTGLTGSSRRREREGNVEVEEYGGNKYAALKAAYDDLIKNPPPGVTGAATIYFGGTSKTEIDRVRTDPDSVGAKLPLGWTYAEDNCNPTPGCDSCL